MAKRKAGFLLKYFKLVAGDRQESFNCGSAGRSGGSSGGEPCLEDNGAGHGEPRLETAGYGSGPGKVDLQGAYRQH